VMCTQFMLKRRDPYAGVFCKRTGAAQTVLQCSHASHGLQGILRRHQPPDLIQPKLPQGRTADLKVSGMGGIEGTTEDSHSTRGKARPRSIAKAESGLSRGRHI